MAGKEASEKAGDGESLIEDGNKSIELGQTMMKPAIQLGAALTKVVGASTSYQSAIHAIATKAGKVGVFNEQDKKKLEEQVIGERLAIAAREQGMASLDLATAVRQMVMDGVDYKDALQDAPELAKYSVSQGVEVGDAAALIAALRKDAGLKQTELPRTLAAIAQFGDKNDMSQAELAKVLPDLLRDMVRLGLKGDAALQQAGAILKMKAEKGVDPKDSGKEVHELLIKLQGDGSDAAKARALAEVAGAVPAANAVPAAPERYLDDAQAKVRATSEQKWAEARHARDGAFQSIGEAYRQESDLAAGTLKVVANFVEDIARSSPGLVAIGLNIGAIVASLGAAIGAVYGAKGAYGLVKGVLTGKSDDKPVAGGKAGGVQRVAVVNFPEHRNGGASEMPDRKGGKNKKQNKGGGNNRNAGRGGGARAASAPSTGQRAASRQAALPRASAATPARSRGAWSTVGSALSTVKNSVGGGLGRVAAFAAPLLKAVALPAAVIGTALQVRNTAEVMAGPGSLEEKIKAGGGLAASVIGGGLGLIAGPVGSAVGVMIGQAAWGLVGDSVSGMAARWWKEGDKPAAAPVAVAAAGATAIPAASAAKPAALSAKPDADGALRAAAEKAAEPAAISKKAPASAAPALPPQFNFSPTISVTVNGDVRDPRRIAEELMPRLRELFALQAEQQQRGALHDVVTI